MLKIHRVTAPRSEPFLERVFQPRTLKGFSIPPIYGVKREILSWKHIFRVALFKKRQEVHSFFFNFETQDSGIQD